MIGFTREDVFEIGITLHSKLIIVLANGVRELVPSST